MATKAPELFQAHISFTKQLLVGNARNRVSLSVHNIKFKKN